MNAAILSIGDELVSGLTVDTNSAWLSEQLAAAGVQVTFHVTVGDDLDRVVAAIRQACAALGPRNGVPCDGGILLITGGLGPTADDITRQAVADALGERLIEDPAALEQVERFFKSIRRPMADSNRVQALRPEGASILENDAGTAPGLRAKQGPIEIFVMPGVPREMKAMFTNAVLPALAGILARGAGAGTVPVRITVKLNTFGMGESVLGEKIKDLMVRGGFDRDGARVSVGTTVHDGIVSVRLHAFGPPECAAAAVAAVRAEVIQRLGSLFYGEGDVALEAVVGDLLRQKQQTIATAESCTGGLIAELLTNTAGSSDFFQRGWVTYANAAKQEELGVPVELLAKHGAVSEEVACAMAQGARKAAGTSLALSTTGIAGPGGGTPEKPVGTVWIGLSDATHTEARRYIFPGSRAQVRLRTAQMALAWLRWTLLGVSPPS